MTERSKAEHELRDRIAKLIVDHPSQPFSASNQILALIKEAGYKAPGELDAWAKANGYVKLNERDKPLILIEEYKVEFPMCGHPELIPIWGQEKPESTRTVGQCPLHNYVCPVCGFGVGCSPACGCSEMRY